MNKYNAKRKIRAYFNRNSHELMGYLLILALLLLWGYAATLAFNECSKFSIC